MKLQAGIIRYPPVMRDNIFERVVKEIAAFWLAAVRKHIANLETAAARLDMEAPPAPPKLARNVLSLVATAADDLYTHAEMHEVEEWYERHRFNKHWGLADFHDDVLAKMLALPGLDELDVREVEVVAALLQHYYHKYADGTAARAHRQVQDYAAAMHGYENQKVKPETDQARLAMREKSRQARKENLERYQKLAEFYADHGVKPRATTRRVWKETVDLAGLPADYPLEAARDPSNPKFYKQVEVILLITKRNKSFAGRYSYDRHITLVAPYGGDIPDQAAFGRLKASIRTTLEHELQHMVQFIMQDSLGKGSERAGTPYGPKDRIPKREGNAAEKTAYPYAKKDERYFLDPIEFFPQVHSWSSWFANANPSAQPADLLERWKAYVGLSSSVKDVQVGKFFAVLKKYNKKLWKRAVGEGWKLVKSKTGWPDSPTGSPFKDAVREKLKQHVDKKRAAVPASVTLSHRGRPPMKLRSAAHRRNRSSRVDSLAARLARTPLRASTRLALEEAASLLALLAMSMEKAKEILGFPPTASPSPDEIKKAYRKKAMEFHPDRGGDQEKMKEVNVAVEVLEGTRRPDRTFEPAPPAPSYTPPSYTPPRSTYTPPKRETITLEDALAPHKAVLSDVAWMFRTTSQKSGYNYMADESSSSNLSYCVYGKKPDGTLIFLGLRNETHSDYDGSGKNIWLAKVLKVPDTGKSTDPSFLTRKVVEALAGVGFTGKFNHKVYDANGIEGDGVAALKKVFNRWDSRAKAVSVKHWLVNSGQVAGDDPKVASRKHVVDLVYKVENQFSRDSKQVLVLVVNGVEKPLSEEDSARAIKAGVLRLVFGNYAYNDSRKNLNKAKFGKKVMLALSQAPSLDDATKTILEKLGADPKAPAAAA